MAGTEGENFPAGEHNDAGHPVFEVAGAPVDDLLFPPEHRNTPVITYKPPQITYANIHPELPSGEEKFYLDQGVPSFELTERAKKVLKDGFDKIISKDNRYYDPEEACAVVDSYYRARFELNDVPIIVFSTGGSNEILDRSEILLADEPNSKPPVYFVGPCFQGLYNSIKRKRAGIDISDVEDTSSGREAERQLPLPWEDDTDSLVELTAGEEKRIDEALGLFTIEAPLENSMNETMRMAIKKAHESDEPSLFYLANTTTTGEVLKLVDIEMLAEVCAEQGHYLIIDEVAEIGLSDKQSAIPLTQTQPNLMVLRSLSKAGLPLLRVGTAFMSPNVGEKFESQRIPHDLDFKIGLAAALIKSREDEEPDVLSEMLIDVNEKITEIKRVFLETCDRQYVPYRPTSDKTASVWIYDDEEEAEEAEGYYNRVIKEGLAVTPGVSFRPTHSKVNNRDIRVMMPGSIEDIPEVVRRLKKALRVNTTRE